MTQPEADTTETRLQTLTDRFDEFAEETRGFVEETRGFMEETRRNREADTKKFDDFVEETRAFMNETRRNRDADTQKLDDFIKETRDTMAYFKGAEYEREVSHTLLSPVSRQLGIRRPRLIHSAAYGTNEEFHIRLEDHMDQQELMEVMLSDAIVRGTHQGEPAYAVVEISLTIGDRDITRAADRAQKLQEASKVRAFPVAIGQHIPRTPANPRQRYERYSHSDRRIGHRRKHKLLLP